MTNVQATVGRVGLLAPVAGKERLEVLDLLRGFALFGILLVNMSYFKAPGGPAGIGNDAGPAGWFTIFGLLLLVESKFFTLFSFLFGLGFAVQLSRGATQPTAFNQRFLRRLAILALFGIAHILLLWEGDILLLYALVGGLLFLFRRASERTLLRWIWWLWLIPTLLFSLGFGGLQLARQLPTTGPQLTQADLDFTEFFMSERTSSEARYQAISYGESIRLRLRNYATTIPLLISRIPTVLAMFLLGFYVGKQQILVQIGDQLSLLRRVRWWGLTVGLSGSLLITLGFALLPPISTLAILFFNQTIGPILSMGYAATLVLLANQTTWGQRFTPLAAAGRMALTNYLLQSVVCTLLFNGYGLGLVGQVSAPLGILIAVAIYGVQICLSQWWLRRFAYGPMEWLWRSLTYGKIQAMSLDTLKITKV